MNADLPISRRAALSAFIALHLAAIWAWCLPDGFALRRALTRPIAPYVVGVGLWQGWDMFSPNPRAVNIRVGAEVELADGAVLPYEFPQMDRLGFWRRYQKERFRKWANDNLRLDKNPDLWQPAAKWVARLHEKPGAEVAKVRLWRRWWDIPPPRASGRLGRLEPPERDRKEFMFYELDRGKAR